MDVRTAVGVAAKPATPLPEGVLPRGAFMKSFEQLAESLGGRPF